MRLVQIKSGGERRVAVVDEPRLRIIGGSTSIYQLANEAIAAGKRLADVAASRLTEEALDYDAIYAGKSAWHLMPAIDQPQDSGRCTVSGTGLTHLGSARGRQSMHATPDEQVTDSMRMFRWGVEGGRPQSGTIGTSPEWFYKGTGHLVRGYGEPLSIPSYALDGGEEAELAGIYIVAPDGVPYRVGMATGNEFSDHILEKKNYLYLASSKLRECAIGPELVLDAEFGSITAHVAVERDGKNIWSREFRTGEAEMCHSLENIEHHHFKFATHRRPGDVHIHFFGTDALSFSDSVKLEEADIMEISFEGFGRALRNRVHVDRSAAALVRVKTL